MPEDLLAGIVKEGTLDNAEEKETPDDSQSENKPKKEEPSHQGDKPEDEPDKPTDEGDEPDKSDDEPDEPKDNTDDEDDKKSDVPFHKHPRFKQIIDDNNSLKKTIEGLTSKQDETDKKLSDKDNKETIPNWFTELYGDNEKAWEMYNDRSKSERKEMKAEILEEIKQEQSKATEETSKWNDWVADEVQSLKDEGLKFDENKLMKIAVEYKPTDDKGNLDLKKAYNILQMQSVKLKNNDRKKVADGTTKQTKSESKNEEFQTAHSLKNQGWH